MSCYVRPNMKNGRFRANFHNNWLIFCHFLPQMGNYLTEFVRISFSRNSFTRKTYMGSLKRRVFPLATFDGGGTGRKLLRPQSYFSYCGWLDHPLPLFKGLKCSFWWVLATVLPIFTWEAIVFEIFQKNIFKIWDLMGGRPPPRPP